MSSIKANYYSGTSGLSIPVPKSQYPAGFQDKSRLYYYASMFNSIEINSIFYKLPRHSTIINWAENVPPDFQFTFKLSKKITHVKGLQFVLKDVNDFISTVVNIGDKKGCILIQFPPSLKIEKLDQLQNLLDTVGEATQNSQWKLAVEFRDPSWYEYEVNEILMEYNAAMVIQDIPKSATPLNYISGDFIYLRFHGPEPGYRGCYSDESLKQVALLINRWIDDNKTIYAYFNNTAGSAFENLQTLNKYVMET